ncbi:hypothetical protein [Actinomadura sediminis]|uniref:LppX_LprAFG lipoprotein n=1 Tax=Actinomadura sediminis TaxID=1038904 RepID=A0ABW3EZJ0_9ACTN
MNARSGRRRSAPMAGALVLLAALPLASGCGGGAAKDRAARFPHDASTLLAAGAGRLESAPSFRLTVRAAMPGHGGGAGHRVDMNGIWDARRPAGRMEGELKGARTTVLAIGDGARAVSYVTLPTSVRERTGRTWLRADRDTGLFAAFPDVHRVAMVLRAAGRLRVTGEAGATWHVRGVVERGAALRASPDPRQRAFAGLLPAATAVDLWTDDAGRPTRIRFTLPAPGASPAPTSENRKKASEKEEKSERTIRGTVELSNFGARPDVREPPAAQVLAALPGDESGE